MRWAVMGVVGLVLSTVISASGVAKPGDVERPEEMTEFMTKIVEDHDGIWFVYFGPREHVFGGDATFYFRYPSTEVIKEWLGE